MGLYWHARLEEGYSPLDDGGSTIHSGLLALDHYKLCDESLWPYDVVKFNKQPPLNAYVDSNKHSMVTYSKIAHDLVLVKHTLSQGYPIALGIVVFRSFMTATSFMSGEIVMPKDSDEAIAGHAI